MERMRKTELRNKIARLRLGISPGEKREWDEKLCREFLQQLEQSAPQPGQMIYLYLDVRNEAGTRQILVELWRRGIRTAVPKASQRELVFYEITPFFGSSGEELRPGYMGIPEPVEEACSRAEEPEALVVVPGVAFDRQGFRLGYGGGFYDRFFAREPKHSRWALAYGFQVMDEIPAEEWDQRMDKIITPGGVVSYH